MEKALCKDNKLSLDSEQLLIDKAMCPEHKNEEGHCLPSCISKLFASVSHLKHQHSKVQSTALSCSYLSR